MVTASECKWTCHMREPESDDWEGRPALPEGSWVIWTDVPITRRKRYHMACNPERQIVYRSMLFSEILQFLEDESITTWHLFTETKSFGLVREWCQTKERP